MSRGFYWTLGFDISFLQKYSWLKCYLWVLLVLYIVDNWELVDQFENIVIICKCIFVEKYSMNVKFMNLKMNFRI